MKYVYMDHAATTPLRPEALEAMLPYLITHYGNASSVYAYGRDARKALDEAREEIAAVIGANPREIIFTGGGSEADNLAIKGVALAYKSKGNHIVTSAVEHHAVLDTCKYLEKDRKSVV